ncbi:polysaccharide biosynthesis tyrosine autokinase [Chlorobium sp. N1]|uniref:polysaccharide biosynthesis tyrosine autokinase n=1 Tax=Chlorobium sp. N1 TaxID=2491138 RepID=UPI0010401D65|nr:polysaccharide biosynthesis tyrosine autokinase [Chlorobium sp. N1]TCD46996.1 polysaccharide biosynthesis tyrosine autokinase [Chlorobium sp. N1]
MSQPSLSQSKPSITQAAAGHFEPQVSVQELLQLFWVKKRLIGLVILLVMLGGVLFHFSQTPEYRYPAMVLIKKSGDDKIGGINPYISLSGSLGNDIVLMQSAPLAEEVVRDLYDEPGRQKLELFGERPYTAPLADFFGIKSEPVDFGSMPREMMFKLLAARLQGRVAISSAKETDILNVTVASPYADEAALLTNALCKAYMRKDIEWNADRAMQVKGFVTEQLDKQKAEINDVDARLSAYMKRENIYELTGNAQSLLTRLVEAESRYNDAKSEQNILRKRRDFIVTKLSEEEKAFMAKVSKSIDRQAGELKARIRNEEKSLIGVEKEPSAESRQQLELLKQRLLDVTRNSLAGELAYSSAARQYQFDLISEQLQIDVRLAELSYVAEEYQRVKGVYNAQLNQLPVKQLTFARLQRDREVLTNTYTFLKGKLEESRIQIASEVGKVVIVGEAYPLGGPVSPNMKKNLLAALILGLGLGGVLVFVQEMLDHSVRDDHFLENHGFVPLALIPFVGETEQRGLRERLSALLKGVAARLPALPLPLGGAAKAERRSSGGSKGKSSLGKPLPDGSGRKPLLIVDRLASQLAESFRELRTNVVFSQADRNIKSLLITGTEVSEGKSTVCVNLATAFALTGKRVLVVDCDLRRPNQHRLVNSNKSPGLVDYLAGVQGDVHSLIQPTTLHENLFLLAAGSAAPNPNELLGSNRMTELVGELEKEWDYVLLDSPPVLLLSDAALISQAVDGIIMVVRVGLTNKNLLREVQKIEYFKKNLLGVAVIGPVDPIGTSGFGRYYGRYGYKGYYGYRRSSYTSYLEAPEEERAG